MNYLTLILLSLSVSMDAFTVSIVDGLYLDNFSKKKMVFTALLFGLFQAIFPLIGYFIGTLFIGYIQDYDHWVAFGLLALIGGKMLFDGIRELIHSKKHEEVKRKPFTYRNAFIQAVATAIDALALGITLTTTIKGISIYLDVTFFFVFTFLISLCGLFLGKQISKLLKNHNEIAEIIGGIVLILIGLKILLNHLNILSF